MKAKTPVRQQRRKTAVVSNKSVLVKARSERQIPLLASHAVAKAAKQARAHGLSVVQVSGNCIISIAPDGTRTPIKKIEARARVVVGQKIRLS